MSQKPKIVDLKMLDTDFAQLAVVDPIAAQLRVVFGPDRYNLQYIQQQVGWYRLTTQQDQQDNLLYRIATSAELFTAAEMEAIDERTREFGFSLSEDERQFIIDWLKCELGIDLEASSD